MDAIQVVTGTALIGALLALSVAVGASLRTIRVSERTDAARVVAEHALEVAEREPAGDLQARVAAIEVRMQALPDLWEEHERRVEGLKRDADRQYSRARAARSAAERARDGADRADDEGYAVRGDDEAGSGGQGVLPLHGDVGLPSDTGQSAPAVNPALDPYFLAGMKPFGA